MKIVLKKTIELNESEILGICKLFERVFHKKRKPSNFKRKFLINIYETSYHSLLVNEQNKIVGCYSSIPQQYYYYGKKLIFALSVETMIDEAYRGNPYTFKKLCYQAYNAMQEDGICFVFAFPNDNIYLLRKKILSWQDIGKLSHYVLPIQINKMPLRMLNPPLKLLIKVINMLINKYQTQIKHSYNIEKINTSQFKEFRYDRGFTVIELGNNAYFSYRIIKKTAHIVDVYPLNKNNLEYAVKNIYQKCVSDINSISYIGNIEFKPINLLKRVCKNNNSTESIFMCGKILNNTMVDDRIYNLDNWSMNLSNYDFFYHEFSE